MNMQVEIQSFPLRLISTLFSTCHIFKVLFTFFDGRSTVYWKWFSWRHYPTIQLYTYQFSRALKCLQLLFRIWCPRTMTGEYPRPSDSSCGNNCIRLSTWWKQYKNSQQYRNPHILVFSSCTVGVDVNDHSDFFDFIAVSALNYLLEWNSSTLQCNSYGPEAMSFPSILMTASLTEDENINYGLLESNVHSKLVLCCFYFYIFFQLHPSIQKQSFHSGWYNPKFVHHRVF